MNVLDARDSDRPQDVDASDDDEARYDDVDHGAMSKNAIISPLERAAICKKRKIEVL